MRIIHLLDTVQPINFGVWNAALAPSTELRRLGVKSYCFYRDAIEFGYPDVVTTRLLGRSTQQLVEQILAGPFAPGDSVVMSHGVWRWPTRVAAALKKRGFEWMYVPQGMLEPWSLSQARWKKWMYWQAVESRLLHRSQPIVRSVSSVERSNLQQKLPHHQHVLIPNGVLLAAQTNGQQLRDNPSDAPAPLSADGRQAASSARSTSSESARSPLQFLFLARLHKKKGIHELLEAWIRHFADQPDLKLTIAGPDEANLMQAYSSLPSNVVYVGPVYGEAKNELLSQAAFYILPSHSEGFPSSVLEAMHFGCVPLISAGCNFPEAATAGLSIRTEPNDASLCASIRQARELHSKPAQFAKLADANRRFVTENYNYGVIAQSIQDCMISLLSAYPNTGSPHPA